MAYLPLEHLQRSEDHWAIVDLVRIGRYSRTVQVPNCVKFALRARTEAGKSGTVRGTRVTEKLV
jgi:hypothetical protein